MHHPHLQMPGAWIEIVEIMPIPGGVGGRAGSRTRRGLPLTPAMPGPPTRSALKCAKARIYGCCATDRAAGSMEILPGSVESKPLIRSFALQDDVSAST
jgi:hypothetical protein